METISSCAIETIGDPVTISLAFGDLVEEVTQCDTLVCSVYSQSYETTRYPSSLLAAVERKFAVSFADLSRRPNLDFRCGLSTWVTRLTDGPTVIVLEFLPEIELEETMLNLALSLEVLIRKSCVGLPARVLMPILGAGAQRY